MVQSVAAWLFLLWLVGLLWILLIYRRDLAAFWAEPMLARPVLIFESDDWGPAGETHVERLRALSALMSRFHDCEGNHPVVTLGVVLAVADGQRIRADELRHYHRRLLSESEFAPIVDAMRQGVEAGTFALQLHGMEHYWPLAVMTSARSSLRVRSWLTGTGIPNTEELSSPLQSRWTDASQLPSKAIAEGDITAAVEEEVAAFASILHQRPEVVVPPTFVWNDVAEAAWAEQGLRVLVTPGRRYESRDRRGEPGGAGRRLVNGQASPSGLTYLVRDDYFEPALGHTAAGAISALDAKSRLGRPTLLEMHRFNFVRDPETADRACREIVLLLEEALTKYPGLAFMSTIQLAGELKSNASKLIETRFPNRLRIWLLRVAELPRLKKLACVMGAGLVAWSALLVALG